MYLQREYAKIFVAEGGDRFETMIDSIVELFVQAREGDTGYVFSQSGHDQCPNRTRNGITLQGDHLRKYVAQLLQLDAQNFTSPKEFYERHQFMFCITVNEITQDTSAKSYLPRQEDEIMASYVQELLDIPKTEWLKENLDAKITSIVEHITESKCSIISPERAERLRGEKYARGCLLHWLRFAIVGGHDSPSILSLMVILGKDTCTIRLREARKYLSSRSSATNLGTLESPSVNDNDRLP